MEANGEPKEVPKIETLALTGGVKLALREPSGSDSIIAAELAGASAMLIPMFEALLCVAAINGQPEPKPRTRQMALALADRIGRSGMDVLSDWFQSKTFPELQAAIAELGADATMEDIGLKVQQLRRERLKNSLQTQ